MEKIKIIREERINAPKSLETIPVGKTVEVPCTEFSPYSTVKSAACRLNQKAGYSEFDISTPDNGATIVITRNKRP